MEDTTHNIHKSIIILSIVVIALVVFAVWQQQQISQIRNAQTISGSNTNSAQQSPVFNQAQSIKNSLLATKTVSGTVVSSNSSEVVIKTALVILSAVDTFDFKKPQALPTAEKNLTIAITKDTAVSGKIIAGVAVAIQTKEPVYGGEALTAVSVDVFAPPTEQNVTPAPDR